MEERKKKTPPIPWTYEETVHLIKAYQDRWYALKRGQLRASQWEEVAVIVTLRCSYDHSNPSAKSGSQCRHKIKKLRKRYRSEKEHAAATTCSWPYFDLMDCLERGPLPISSLPLTEYHCHQNEEEEEEDDDDDNDGVVGVRYAVEMREFAERLSRMEKRKIEMIRESDRWRIEMEKKRIQMIVDSERKIMDIIATIFEED